MNSEQVLEELRAADAYLEGHFVLSSGRHSPVYVQCARALMDPARSARLCGALATIVRDALTQTDQSITLCVSPAMGGVVIGYEMARQLGIPSIFAERQEGEFRFRRGFQIAPGTECLVVEDVVTTGGAVRECVTAVHAAGGRVPLAAALVDRSDGQADTGAPLVSLLRINAPTYPPDHVPLELAAIPPDRPGSRHLSG